MESKLHRINMANGDLNMVKLTVGQSEGNGKLLANRSWIWSVFDPPRDKRKQPSQKGKVTAEDSNYDEEGPAWITKGTLWAVVYCPGDALTHGTSSGMCSLASRPDG